MGSAIRVVLLNWNERKQAEHCLDRLHASESVDLDVLVVDNGSTGDDVERFRERIGADRVVALPENTGYAGGMNAGLRFWRSRPAPKPILLITPDASVATDTLRRLAAELEAQPDVGIVGPLVIHSSADGGRLSAGGWIDPRRVSARFLDEPLADRPYPVDWIDGCCMLIRPSVLDSVEPFDDRYFIYYEETDLCARVVRAGWQIRVVPAAAVHHPKAPGTLPSYYFYYMVRNRYLFWRKNFGIRAPRVAAVVAGLTVRAWASVAKSLALPGRRRDWRARLRDARLQLRAARVGTLDHLNARYGRIPESRMPRS